MQKRAEALKELRRGDIFHAVGSTGSSRICIVVSVTGAAILGRHIASQHLYEFDRSEGVAVRNFPSETVSYTIDSVAAPPEDIREILLEMDGKCREVEYRRAEDPDWKRPFGFNPLTEDEIRALLFIRDLHRANPI